MGFIHSKETQGPFGVHGLECPHEALSAQQLRSDEKEPDGGNSRFDILQNAAALLSRLCGGQEVAFDALLLQIGNLILHERCKAQNRLRSLGTNQGS